MATIRKTNPINLQSKIWKQCCLPKKSPVIFHLVSNLKTTLSPPQKTLVTFIATLQYFPTNSSTNLATTSLEQLLQQMVSLKRQAASTETIKKMKQKQPREVRLYSSPQKWIYLQIRFQFKIRNWRSHVFILWKMARWEVDSKVIDNLKKGSLSFRKTVWASSLTEIDWSLFHRQFCCKSFKKPKILLIREERIVLNWDRGVSGLGKYSQSWSFSKIGFVFRELICSKHYCLVSQRWPKIKRIRISLVLKDCKSLQKPKLMIRTTKNSKGPQFILTGIVLIKQERKYRRWILHFCCSADPLKTQEKLFLWERI